MNTISTFFASATRLGLAALLPVSFAYAQTQLHPQVDDQTTYFPVSLTLADSGTTGTMAVWDLSTALYEPNDAINYTYRLPSPNELNLHPEVTVVEEGTNGVKRLLRDSATYLKQYQYVNPQGSVFTYSQPATLFTFPIQYGTTTATNCEVSYVGGVLFDVLESTVCSVTGSGTLLTPLETFDNVYKLSYHHTRDYYVADTFLTTVHLIEVKWVSEVENAVLASMLWNDLDSQTVAVFRSSASSAATAELKESTIILYPNPAADLVYLSEEVDEYTVTDQLGRIVLTGKGTVIDVNNLAKGSYRVRLENDGKINDEVIQIIE